MPIKLFTKWLKKKKKKPCKTCRVIKEFVEPEHKLHFLSYHKHTNSKAILVLMILVANQFLFMKMIADAGELTELNMLDCSNQMRVEQGHEPLYFNDQLTLAANNKLEDMEYYNYWAHANPETGKKPWDFVDEAGYYYATTGENLAIGYLDSEEVCQAWRNSPVHYANIINESYQEVGFAINKADLHENGNGLLVVQMFGSRDDFMPPENADYIKEEYDNISTLNSSQKQNPGSAVKGAKADSVVKEEANPMSKLWNLISSNILLFIVISAYFVVRSVVMCKRKHGGVIQKKCIVVLTTFLILATASVSVFIVTNFIL